MDIAELERQTPKFIRHYPNTYTFTKALTEMVLAKRRENIPLAFVRPTIVGCAIREPVPGWIDSVSAVASAVLYTGIGVVHFLQGKSVSFVGSIICCVFMRSSTGDHQVVADIVPVDSVINVTLACIPATIQNYTQPHLQSPTNRGKCTNVAVCPFVDQFPISASFVPG